MEYSKATNWNGSPGSSTASLDSTGATSGAPHFEIGMSCFNQRVNGGFVIVYKPTFTSLKGPHPVVSHIVRRVGDLLSVIFWRQYGVPILTTHQFLFVLFTMLSWLVVWNMFLFFHIWIIIPTDLLIFFRGVGSTTSEWTSAYLMTPILSIPSGNQKRPGNSTYCLNIYGFL